MITSTQFLLVVIGIWVEVGHELTQFCDLPKFHTTVKETRRNTFTVLHRLLSTKQP